MCVAGTNEWRIDHEFASNGRDAWYFDGTNVYHRIQQLRDPDVSTNSSLRQLVYLPFEQVKSNITIEIVPSPGGHPLGDLGVNIPWLAFCSGIYLRLSDRIIPLPTAFVHEDIGAFGYRDKTTVFEDQLGLPIEIELFTSHSLYKASLNDQRLLRWPEHMQRARMHPAPKYPDGVRAFHFKVTETTNFADWIIPTVFTYTTYAVSQGDLTKPYVGGIGRVLSMQPSTAPQNVFMPEMNQTIVDYRFRHPTLLVDGILYKATNATAAPPITDPHLRAKFDLVVRHPPRDLTLKSHQRWLFGMLLIVVGLAPVLVLWRSSKLTSKPNKKL